MVLTDRERARARAGGRRRSVRYGVAHQRLRERFRPLVDSGLARCARCGGFIEPGSSWDLGHDDRDPSRYAGPEHAVCNRGAPGRNVTSRVW